MPVTGRYLAFDMGAESSRAIVATLEGGRVRLQELHRCPTRNVEVRGIRYWDILYVWSEFRAALRQYARVHGAELDGIGVDSWGVDFGVIGETGRLLGNPVHHRDHRTDGILERAFEVVPRSTIYGHTGIQCMPFNTLYQLWAMHRTAPELLHSGHRLLMIPDLINYFLSNRAVCEYTNATTTQLFDVKRGEWSWSLMQIFAIPEAMMPEIVQPATILGPLEPRLREETGLNAPVIAPCTHDTGSAVAGVPAHGGKWAYISSGTWSTLGAELPGPLISEKALNFNFTNEGGINGTIRFLKNIMGLWVLQQCREAWARLGENYEYDALARMAREASPFQTFINIDDPLFLNPPDMLKAVDDHCRATGQEPPGTVGATARAILEGLAFRYAIVLEELEDTIGSAVETIHMVGGGVKNELLCQFTANVTGRPVIAGPVEAAAMGNVVVQAMATGQVADHEEARRIVADSSDLRTWEPREAEAWRRALAEFRRRYEV